MKQKFDHKYFSSFWRKGSERRFHPVYDFRTWYIKELLQKYHLTNIIDVGCGTGLIVLALRNLGINAWGIDISKAAFENVHKEMKTYFSVGDIKNLSLKSKSFQSVSCIDVLEHIEKNDISRAIQECARISKKIIYFDITSLEDFLFIHSDATHVSKLFSWQWHELLRKILGKEWKVKRGPILPFLHHGVFIAERI